MKQVPSLGCHLQRTHKMRDLVGFTIHAKVEVEEGGSAVPHGTCTSGEEVNTGEQPLLPPATQA
jgi:hypothetical protein